jgi:hypothetical protein
MLAGSAALRGRVAVCLGAATAVLVLVALAAPRSAPAALLAAHPAPQAKQSAWAQQENALWHGVERRAAPRVLRHGEQKLRQIVRGLRSNHLLRGAVRRAAPAARQPHFGPGKVVEQPAAAPGMRVFKGRMLCAEGESSCVHPCNAFYTITGEEPPEDCKCKCTSPNPHEFYKQDSVICTCPGSPIGPENDMYPYPPGEGPMAAIEAAQAAADAPAAAPTTAATAARAPTALVGAADADADAEPAAADAADVEQPEQAADAADVEQPAQPEEGPVMARRAPTLLAGMGFMGVKEHEMHLERDIDRRLAAMGVEVKPLQQMQQPALRPTGMPYGSAMMAPGGAPPQGLWVGAGPAFLPPDGDYPGGSTGIPADGYLAFETGHGTQPYHGTYAPMQEAGIANRARATSLRQGRSRPQVLSKSLGLPKVTNTPNP